MTEHKPFPVRNTLALRAHADDGEIVRSLDRLQALRAQVASEWLVLGEGSNIVPHQRVRRFVVQMAITGVEYETQGEDVLVKAWAGENWHSLVMQCLERGAYGLENLALIPGSVGAAPIQNIGAYGVELSRFVEGVGVLDAGGQLTELLREQCAFGYRDSLFKADRTLTVVYLRLRLHAVPKVNLTYAELNARFAGQTTVTPLEVAEAVMDIRRRKLPDFAAHPNVGSFFKNPVVDADRLALLTQRIPALSRFEVENGFKLSAAQLIDLAGWKRHEGPVRCWPNQPLVLVNEASQDAAAVLQLAAAIQADVRERYSVELELEPAVLD